MVSGPQQLPVTDGVMRPLPPTGWRVLVRIDGIKPPRRSPAVRASISYIHMKKKGPGRGVTFRRYASSLIQAPCRIARLRLYLCYRFFVYLQSFSTPKTAGSNVEKKFSTQNQISHYAQSFEISFQISARASVPRLRPSAIAEVETPYSRATSS